MKKILSIFVVSFLFLAGCQQVKIESAADTELVYHNTIDITPLFARTQQNNASDGGLQDGLQKYSDCIAVYSTQAFEDYNDYLSWVDLKKGPTGKEKDIKGVQTLPDIQNCVQKIDQLMRAPFSKDALDKASDDYTITLTQLDGVLKQAHDYYEQQEYLRDGMEQGDQYHVSLLNAWNKFFDADKNLRLEVYNLQYPLEEKALNEFQQNSDPLTHLMKKTLFLAKSINKDADTSSILKLDTAKFYSELNHYRAVVQELETFLQAHPEKRDQLDFLTKGKAFLTSAEALWDRGYSRKIYSKEEQRMLLSPDAWNVEGSPQNVAHAYEEL